MDLPGYKPPDMGRSRNVSGGSSDSGASGPGAAPAAAAVMRCYIKKEVSTNAGNCDDDSCVPVCTSNDQASGNIQKVPSISDLSEDNSLGKVILTFIF